ncbi:hypothetical protein HDV05_002303 [Chytridiales sp. JEL 0842]|nr:hypothetical protein HDV05_002303 [Chytridiales sp. JEL 0842]
MSVSFASYASSSTTPAGLLPRSDTPEITADFVSFASSASSSTTPAQFLTSHRIAPDNDVIDDEDDTNIKEENGIPRKRKMVTFRERDSVHQFNPKHPVSPMQYYKSRKRGPPTIPDFVGMLLTWDAELKPRQPKRKRVSSEDLHIEASSFSSSSTTTPATLDCSLSDHILSLIPYGYAEQDHEQPTKGPRLSGGCFDEEGMSEPSLARVKRRKFTQTPTRSQIPCADDDFHLENVKRVPDHTATTTTPARPLPRRDTLDAFAAPLSASSASSTTTPARFLPRRDTFDATAGSVSATTTNPTPARPLPRRDSQYKLRERKSANNVRNDLVSDDEENATKDTERRDPTFSDPHILLEGQLTITSAKVHRMYETSNAVDAWLNQKNRSGRPAVTIDRRLKLRVDKSKPLLSQPIKRFTNYLPSPLPDGLSVHLATAKFSWLALPDMDVSSFKSSIRLNLIPFVLEEVAKVVKTLPANKIAIVDDYMQARFLRTITGCPTIAVEEVDSIERDEVELVVVAASVFSMDHLYSVLGRIRCKEVLVLYSRQMQAKLGSIAEGLLSCVEPRLAKAVGSLGGKGRPKVGSHLSEGIMCEEVKTWSEMLDVSEDVLVALLARENSDCKTVNVIPGTVLCRKKDGVQFLDQKLERILYEVGALSAAFEPVQATKYIDPRQTLSWKSVTDVLKKG